MLLRLKAWASACTLLLFLTGASRAYQSKKQDEPFPNEPFADAFDPFWSF